MPPSQRIQVHIRLRPPSTSSNNTTSPSPSPSSRVNFDLNSNTITLKPPVVLNQKSQITGIDDYKNKESRDYGGLGSDYSTTTLQHSSSQSNLLNANTDLKFQYDKLHPSTSTNQDIYSSTVKPLVMKVMEGFNCTVLMYGQTGSGKTFTCFGPSHNSNSDSDNGGFGFEDRGITARAISDIFALSKSMKEGNTNTEVEVRMSVLEIYNENMFDLVNSITPPPQLSLYDNPANNNQNQAQVQVRNLYTPQISNQVEALNYIFKALANRSVDEHKMNDRSSRSHCVVTFYFLIKKNNGGSMTSSKLNIVDLAGSERLSQTQVTVGGVIQRESSYINKSLSFLEMVVVGLTKLHHSNSNGSGSSIDFNSSSGGGGNKDGFIPYRQSKLTYYLKDTLGGNTNTVLLACIWLGSGAGGEEESSHYEQSRSTLKFARRMMGVRNLISVNDISNNNSNNGNNISSYGGEMTNTQQNKFLKTIKLLKEELQMYASINAHESPHQRQKQVQYSAPTPSDLQRIKVDVESYIDDESKMMDVLSVTHVKAVLGVMRDLILSSRLDKSDEESRSEGRKDGRVHRAITDSKSDDYNSKTNSNGDGDGNYDENISASVMSKRLPFGKTNASKIKRGSDNVDDNDNDVASSSQSSTQPTLNVESSLSPSPSLTSPSAATSSSPTPVNTNQTKEQNFKTYKAQIPSGILEAKNYETLKMKIKDIKAAVKRVKGEVLEGKGVIDGLISEVNEVGDENEEDSLEINTDLRKAQEAYDSKLASLAKHRDDLKGFGEEKDRLFNDLVRGFDEWDSSANNADGGDNFDGNDGSGDDYERHQNQTQTKMQSPVDSTYNNQSEKEIYEKAMRNASKNNHSNSYESNGGGGGRGNGRGEIKWTR